MLALHTQVIKPAPTCAVLLEENALNLRLGGNHVCVASVFRVAVNGFVVAVTMSCRGVKLLVKPGFALAVTQGCRGVQSVSYNLVV